MRRKRQKIFHKISQPPSHFQHTLKTFEGEVMPQKLKQMFTERSI